MEEDVDLKLDAKVLGYGLAAFIAMAIWLTAAVFVADAAAQDAGGPMASGHALASSTAELGADSDAVTVSADGCSAKLDGASFNIDGFSRANKGTNRPAEGTYYGYRYAMAAEDAFAVIVRDDMLLVYIPSDVAARYGADASDLALDEPFLTMLEALDAGAARGGLLLSELGGEPVYFTSEPEVSVGQYTYRFAVEAEIGHWYATASLEGSQDGSGGALFVETGVLVGASDTTVAAAPTGLAWLQRFFQNLDWQPLWVSLRTAGVAIAIIFVLGLLAAWLTVRMSDKIKGVLDTIFTIPMVLPPTVCGFLLMLLFGKSTAVGQWLIEHGIDLVFTWPAAVISCVVVGFPLMYRTVRGAFESLDPNMLDAVRTLGWSEPRLFRKVTMPLAWPSIAAGTVLAFARAMGEFGCTLFFAGNYPGVTQTIPIAIYYDWMGNRSAEAIFWVILVIVISFAVILAINLISSRTQRYRRQVGE